MIPQVRLPNVCDKDMQRGQNNFKINNELLLIWCSEPSMDFFFLKPIWPSFFDCQNEYWCGPKHRLRPLWLWMKQVLLLWKWGIEVDEAGMKQAKAEDWRAEMSEGGGWGLAGGSRRVVVQEYWTEKQQLITQPTRKAIESRPEA